MKTITFLGRALMLRLIMLLLFVGFTTIGAVAQVQDTPPTCVAMAVNPAISCPNSVVTATATVADIIITQPAHWIINPNLSGAYFVDNGLTTLAASISADGNYSTTINVGPNAGFGFTVVLAFDNYPDLQTCAASPLVKAPIANAGIDDATCYNNGVNQIQLSGSASAGTAPYTYEWTAGPIAFLSNVNIANPILNNAPVGVHTFTLTVTDVNGCVDTDTVDLEIYATPTADAGDDDSVCWDGGTNTMTLNGSASGGTGPYTYAWSGDTTYLSATNIADPTFDNAPVGTYNLTLTVTDDNGCEDTDTVQLMVDPSPTADAGDDDATCYNNGENQIQLSGSASGGTSPYTYAWSGPAIAYLSAANIQNPTLDDAPVGVHTFTLTVTDDNGCVDTDTVVLEIYANPTADAGDDDATCFNGGVNQIQLSGSASGGTSPYTYAWSGPAIAYLSATNIENPTLNNAPVGVHTFTLTVTDANGCEDTDTVAIEIYANPTADAGDDDATCYNNGENQIQLSVSASGGTAPYTYEWTDGPISYLSNINIANPTLDNAPVGVHTFTLTVTDANGCMDTDTVDLEIYASPICSASNNGPICAGDDVILSETGGDAVSWLWSSNGAATFNDATLQNPTASGAVNGEIFTVMITDENGCTSTCTTTVTVEPCADEGCTLGYWKTHTDRWCESYRTCDLFGSVFVDAPSDLANKTLLEALNLGGGGIYNLARQGVAALLNACSGEVDYAGYSDDPQLVINAVNAAFRAGGKEPGMLAYQLDVLNNSGCPLGGTKATSAPNSNCLNGASKVAVPDKSAVIDSSVDFKVYPVPFEDIINVSYRFEYDTDVTIQVFNLQGGLMYGVVDNLYNNGEVAVKQINLPKTFDQALIIRLTTNKEKLSKNIVAKSSTQR